MKLNVYIFPLYIYKKSNEIYQQYIYVISRDIFKDVISKMNCYASCIYEWVIINNWQVASPFFHLACNLLK